MQNLEDKIKIKEFVSIIIWSMKLQLLASVPMYILYFITRILNTILPILTSFISAQIINSLVNSLSNGSTVFASSLIIWVILLFASYTLEAFGNNFFVYSDIMLQYQ